MGALWCIVMATVNEHQECSQFVKCELFRIGKHDETKMDIVDVKDLT